MASEQRRCRLYLISPERIDHPSVFAEDLRRWLTTICLGFLMVHVGYEFDIDKRDVRPYAIDYGVAATAAASPVGERWLGDFNCTACHVAGPTVNGRLAPHIAPRLGRDGARVTPQWVRAWLADPQAFKPGTAMPDVLHALPAAEKADAVEALTHFVISLQSPEPAKPAAMKRSSA